jgi:hypothetical protein
MAIDSLKLRTRIAYWQEFCAQEPVPLSKQAEQSFHPIVEAKLKVRVEKNMPKLAYLNLQC